MNYIVQAAIMVAVTGRQQLKYISRDKAGAIKSANMLNSLFQEICRQEQGRYTFSIQVLDATIMPAKPIIRLDSMYGRCEYENPKPALTTDRSART